MNGYWAYNGPQLDDFQFAAFTHSQTHRGPDGFGIDLLDQGRLWLGHRRLAILDISDRGRQPMVYGDGRYWLTYNGELYNYIELRHELKRLGHHFISDTDSEVILAAYAQWGADCQMRFNGMWAFAIWDNSDRKLFLSRDRFGIKPLHYRSANGTFSFASELKAFLALPEIDGRFDDALLAETLVNINGQEGTPHTLLPGVKRLPGGYCATVSPDGHVHTRKWWETLDHVGDVSGRFDKQANEFRGLFIDSCRLRLRSDVPVATSLSGGLDSSAVACTLAELGKGQKPEHAPDDWQRAFIACFPGTELDEREYAEQVVDFTGLSAVFEDIDDAAAVDSIEEVIFDLEAIYWVPLVGPWAIYKSMRDNGIRVSLDGHGADEMLGGYHFFVERALDGLLADQFSLRRYLDLKKVLAGLVGGSGQVTRAGMKDDLVWLLKRELKKRGVDKYNGNYVQVRGYLEALQRRLSPSRGQTPSESEASTGLLAAPVAPPLFPFASPHQLYDESSDARAQGMSALDSALFTWFHGSVLPTILRSYDRASMSHGIEVRMPFMDWRLVCFAFSLPEESKVGNGFTKRVLRQAMKGIMPEQIRVRTNKIGFTTPLDHWMRGALREWVLDLTGSRAFRESSVWNGPVVRVILERALQGHGSTNAVWPIIHAHILQMSFMEKAKQNRPNTA